MTPATNMTAAQWANMTSAQRADFERAVSDAESRNGQGFVHTRDDQGRITITDRATGKIVETRV